MADNSVAANILMFAFIIGGLLVLPTLKQETFPSSELDYVTIRVPYPGAGPAEVAEGIILPIEEQLRGLEIIEQVEATAQEGSARVVVELASGADRNRGLQDVKNAVDQVSIFPENSERPVVELMEQSIRVLDIILYGPLTERQLFDLTEQVRSDLLAKDGVTQLEVRGVRSPEISIEIPEATLRGLGLTLRDVAAVVREAARDVPAGGVRTAGGEVLLRLNERRERAQEYADIPLVSATGGAKVLLGDVAEIRDGFEDKDLHFTWNGEPAARIRVFQTDVEKPLEVAKVVKTYLAEELRPSLPKAINYHIASDASEVYRARLSLLLRNGAFGLTLVLIMLALFLELRLALWVAIGIAATMVGSILILPLTGVTINLMSLFGFIVTLGIVVDDAVIVGENIFHRIRKGEHATQMDAAVAGAQEMATPVMFAVSTNIIAFLPLLFVPGRTGEFMSVFPLVVIAVFTVSLVEALFILPSHLGHTGVNTEGSGLLGRVARAQRRLADGFDAFVETSFKPALRWALARRYLFLTLLLSIVSIMYAYTISGRLKFSFVPQIGANSVELEGALPFGSPFELTRDVAKEVEAAGLRAAAKFGPRDDVLDGASSLIGNDGAHAFDIDMVLASPEKRVFSSVEFARAWREEMGEIPGVESLVFSYQVGPARGADVSIEIAHPDQAMLEAAEQRLAESIRGVAGVVDVDDGFAAGKPQLDFVPTAEGQALGLTATDIGREARAAFYGAEALRLQRGRHEVRVMVRGPESERRSLSDVEDMMLRAPGGGEIPLSAAATLAPGRADVEIERVDGRRVVNVRVYLDPQTGNDNEIRDLAEREFFPMISAEFPGIDLRFQGRQREQAEAMGVMRSGVLLALTGIFVLLASLFRSYSQALIVMAGIPVSLAAALFGHVLLGVSLSITSIFGMIALCGLVVNAGLVINQEINRRRGEGADLLTAGIAAAGRRFRPVVVTSLTTCIGLMPMILERSIQARFLAPTAISLGFGVLFAGVTMLFLTPVLRLAGADLSAALRRLWKGDKSPAPAPSPAE